MPADTHFTLEAPVNVMFDYATDVAAPSSIPLMLLGALMLVLRRHRAGV